MEKLFRVAVNAPIKPNILTYISEEEIDPGSIVRIPLGRRKEKGVVLGEQESYDGEFKLKKILEVENSLSIAEPDMKLYEWMAKYYHYSLGKLIIDTLPKFLKRPRELKFYEGKNTTSGFDLNEKQSLIYKSLESKLQSGFSKSLLHGITGSGKTAIYLNLIKEVNKLGKSVLFLLPEINLTSQFVASFQEVLDCPIYTYNSAISNSDRFGLWKLLQDNEKPLVVIGVRSSIFLPISNLGLIIVDEEHDGSFKQDDRCPYHARDVAIKKSALLNIPILLGSATPSLESYQGTKNSENYYVLKDRFGGASKPRIELIDMRKEEEWSENWPLTKRTIEKIEDALTNKEQVLVFVNRLGFASFVQCKSCGHQFFCKNCSTPLKYFKRKNHLNCQHCAYEEPYPSECPDCGNLDLLQKGFGTEKIVEVLNKYFPEYKVARFDRDEIKTIANLEERLGDFHRGEIDILVGTQMLSKGHNFKKVNKVFILGTDNQLSYPDFRSQEKVYQIVSQVAGRAGRFSDKGEVFIQTLLPSLKVYKAIETERDDEFVQEELKLREEMEYPPFTRMVVLYLSSRFFDRLQSESMNILNELRGIQRKAFPQVDVFGPIPCMIEKRSNQFTWQFVLKSPDVNELHNLLFTFEESYKLPSSFSLKVDVDPQIFS